MSIHLLPDDLISQIAAGEVVERPVSVVKELLENALDAQPSQISIAVGKAGKKLVEIADDGVGIPVDELLLAVTRHATSKIDSVVDLERIGTLGFRGEALASIASVSRMTLTSRSRTEPSGGKVVVDGGQVGRLEKIASPGGTTVRVEDLFYNVPARLKFLKRDATEQAQIDALVTRYALAYPGVRMRMTQDGGKVSLQTAGNHDRREVLANLYGVEIAREMLEVLYEDDAIRLTGFISPTSITRSNRREITFFVNGRWVQDISLSTALLQGYHTLLMVGRYPIVFLFVELPPDKVDVNVHPTKAQVRFENADQIFTGVQRAVRRSLMAYNPITRLSTFSGTPVGTSNREIDPSWKFHSQVKLQENDGLTDREGAVQGGFEALPAAENIISSRKIPLLRLVGQVGAAYLVAEGPDGLYLVDQHAAHERILFEKFMQQRDTNIPAQALLEPVVLNLPPHSANLLNSQLELINGLGFQVESFGPGAFVIRAIPSLILGSDPAQAVRVIVEDFEEDEKPLEAEIEARMIARVCKRAAVKAGQTLSPEEQGVLLRDLEACQSPRTCPHGRPTMIHLSVDLLERQFGRKGSR